MKKIVSLFAVALFTGFVAVSAQDLDKILDKHYEAVGQKKLAKVETLSSSGKLVQMGMEFPFTLVLKRPDKLKMTAEVQGMEIVQAYNGETGWMIMPMTGTSDPQDMTDQQIKAVKQMGDIDGDLYNWKKKGFQLSLLGKDTLETTPVYKIKVVKDNGDEFIYYLDAEKYLVLKTDTKSSFQGTEVEASTYYSDFKTVEGMNFPFNIESKVNNQTVSEIIVGKYEVNNKVDDSIFEKPETKEEQQ